MTSLALLEFRPIHRLPGQSDATFEMRAIGQVVLGGRFVTVADGRSRLLRPRTRHADAQGEKGEKNAKIMLQEKIQF